MSQNQNQSQNQHRIEIMVKRAVFMASIMIPIVVVLEFTGNNSAAASAITGAILAGISLVMYPDQPRTPKSEEANKKKEQPEK